MAVVINNTTLNDGDRNVVVKCSCYGAAATDVETDAVKIDLSALTVSSDGRTPTHLTIDKIDYSINGYEAVILEFDATTDDQIAVLSGDGCIEFPGGLVDPESAGGTGDIIVTTKEGNTSAENGYTLVIYARKKYD